MSQISRIGAVGLVGLSAFLQVDHFHSPGETVHARHLHLEFGGKASNQAVAAFRMGTEVTFFGAVGTDENGIRASAFLESEGVQPCLEQVQDVPSAYACILTDKQGENQVSVYAGAASHLSEAFIRSQESRIQACDLLLTGLECPWEATLAVLDIAQSSHIPVILNPAPAQQLPIDQLRRFSLLTPNIQEAATLLGLPQSANPVEICQALAAQDFPITIVTLGAWGAMLWDGMQGVLFNPAKATPVDTTGAGDCFNGVLAAMLVQGKSLEFAISMAIRASAKSVETAYVLPSLPHLRDLSQVPTPAGRVIFRKA